jgi:hypothetical protein
VLSELSDRVLKMEIEREKVRLRMPYVRIGRSNAVHTTDGGGCEVLIELIFSVIPEATQTWVPLSKTQRQCECRKCSRTGYALKTAKSKTLHGLQGLEIGPPPCPMGRLLVSMSASDEASNPGMRYVSHTRSKLLELFGLAAPLSYEDLEKLYQGSRYASRIAELERLRETKAATRSKYAAFKFGGQTAAHTIGTKRAYAALLQWLVRYCRRTCEGVDTNEARMTLQKCTTIEADLADVEF